MMRRDKLVRELLRKYRTEAASGLLYVQLVEEAVRTYVRDAYSVVRRRLGGGVVFRYDHRDLRGDSLTALLAKFRKLNTNSALASRVNRLVKERQYIAGMAHVLMTEEIIDDKYLQQQLERATKLIGSAKECQQEIERERQKLLRTKSG